ncbi:MAG: DUF4834 family protein [Flavobacteriales bacterium]|nr:DUF4834 family protein [Flavobacteriales bacterium]
MGLLRTLLIIALVYYGFKILARLFAPYLQKYAVNKMRDKFDEQNDKRRAQEDQIEPEGKTTIINKPKADNELNTDKTGDYIDYEEID